MFPILKGVQAACGLALSEKIFRGPTGINAWSN
jgi:hypothetical protein